MIPLDVAQAFVRESLRPLSPVTVELQHALNCVSAEAVTATESVPGFANSAMDGYAVRAEDTTAQPVRLEVVGSVLAGDKPKGPIGQFQAMRVMTGAPIPEGSDSVCKIEDVSLDALCGAVVIPRRIGVGENVRYPGEDISAGQTLIKEGSELGVTEIGMLAGQGITSLLVYPLPRVGVLSTGNELARSGGELGYGEIRDVNRPMLVAALTNSGFLPVDLGIVPDDRTSLEEAFRRAAIECDAVISTGGVSVGDVDLVKTVITELCGERSRWMQVAVKPGKPLTFGVTGAKGTPLFGLPGNPVATLASFELYVRPSLRILGGHEKVSRPTFAAKLDCPLPRRCDGTIHLVHVDLSIGDDGRTHVVNVRRQGSHLVSAVSGANGIAMVPDGDGYGVGDTVTTTVIGPLS
ncbi:MAG: gephyrin-like molybdotransferase Glp [Acidimicrobiales bacterium]